MRDLPIHPLPGDSDLTNQGFHIVSSHGPLDSETLNDGSSPVGFPFLGLSLTLFPDQMCGLRACMNMGEEGAYLFIEGSRGRGKVSVNEYHLIASLHTEQALISEAIPIPSMGNPRY